MAKIFVCTCNPKFPERMCIKCVADFLDYSVWTVYRKAEEGEIPSRPITRRHRVFIRESIYYWFKNGEENLAA